MENVKIGLENVENKTNNSIKVLLSIDKVKERVEDSEKALKKVDNWAQLVQEAEQSFQDRDINSISEKIGQLDSSILIFQGAPDFGEKTKLLDQFKNRLESSLMSSVVTSVQTQDLESAKLQYAHFKKIDRAEQFKSYYIKTVRSQIKNLWEEKDECERIVTVYEDLENNLKNHINFIKSVFGDEECGNVLLQLYSSILNNLPVKETIKNLSQGEREPEESFVTLGSIRLISSNFMNAVRTQLADEVPAGKKEIDKFVQSIWQPFGHSMVHYETLLSQLLLARASQLRIDGDMMNLSENFSQTKSALHDLHNEVLQYSSDVTDNFGLKMTLTSLQKAHEKLSERAIVAMENAKVSFFLGRKLVPRIPRDSDHLERCSIAY